jgi:hypothetical protein
MIGELDRGDESATGSFEKKINGGLIGGGIQLFLRFIGLGALY